MTAQTSNLAAALAAVQAKLPTIAKGETAEVEGKSKTGVPYKYKYSYADLADVSAVILPMLGAVGLSWITKPTHNDAGRFVLVYKLRHTGGEEEAGEYPLPQSGSPQEIGSAITYARRYALCAVTGVAPASDDDDGAAATHRAQRGSFEDARPVRPDPEHVRQNILANARTAIDGSPLGGLPAIQERIDGLASREAISEADHADLCKRIQARRDLLNANRERSLPDAGQPAMDGDWPEPARPGGNNPT